MITALNFTDFVYRPRRPEELDTRAAAASCFGQAAHQIDVVRLLAGGRLRTLRAQTGAWDRGAANRRRVFGAAGRSTTARSHRSLTAATRTSIPTNSAMGSAKWGSRPMAPDYGMARRRLAAFRSSDDEVARQGSARFWRRRRTCIDAPSAASSALRPGDCVSCERADLRPTPTGVTIYADFERRHESLPPPTVPRREVIDELHDAVVDRRHPTHDGEWGLATLEASLAILQSARERREIVLQHQVALR